MIDIYNPSYSPRLGGEGLSVDVDSTLSVAYTDSALSIYSVEFPLQPCELSLVTLNVAPSRRSTIEAFRAYLRYSIEALNDENDILMYQQCTYQLGESTTRTSPIHTIVVPKGATKMQVRMGSGVDLRVSKENEASFNESTS
ncbi:hypothetical protein QR676_00070 [Vibrio sp. TMPB1044]|uniref:hypothetical protein n=1 Tax=Vibrio sp. TMPB1044 TaxID=3051822 RepID=UPI00255BCD4B|nr:hypothetical protein [Vibrio sp. TMPB1044]MDL5025613.1 hypothetical protein [Vibrio sp. TMPB1044]MDN5205741.1 hypothetical protein [Vibrio sp. TMPB1044]